MFVSAGICGANIAKRRRVYVTSNRNIKAKQVSKGREPFGGALSVPFCRHGQKGTSSAHRHSSVPRRAGAAKVPLRDPAAVLLAFLRRGCTFLSAGREKYQKSPA